MPHNNRLSNETSPYLLQHAHNPVDWYPWGPEAFEAARKQDKPIFLSVGYSTCYWCHVMERQSFESDAIAAEMNQRFINIKVDREERPDVDQLYMLAVQVLTHHGGWPMSVFLLPDLRPFYGGTYFPPLDMQGRPGFVTILRAIEDAYKNRREDVEKSASQLHDILQQIARPVSARQRMKIDDAFIGDLLRRSTSDYDAVHGGFGPAPKFPRETMLELILCSDQSQIANPKSQIRHTLDAMANGGIRDHLGGGFHRYSTDAQWLVPHFEIMLYDNAMLGWCYAEALRQTGESRYGRIAEGVFDFVLREMTSPDGAFYTAFDAEVDAQEGEPYVWTKDRIESILGPGEQNGDAASFLEVYGVDRGPNFADPHGGSGMPDKNVLYLPDGPAMEDDPRIVAAREKLYQARRQRKQPLLDTKIITSWNGLMIRALAHAAKVLDKPRYLDGASSAATFLLRHHLDDDGTLYRTSRDGQRKYHGFLDDYAFLVQGLLALHQAGGAESWRDRAEALARTMVQKFGSSEGGFYFSDESAKDLIVRQMVASDSPLPSGNAVAARVMMELGENQIAQKTIATFAQQMLQQGEGMSAMVLAAGEYVRRVGPIEVAAAPGAQAERPVSSQEVAGSVLQLRAQWRSARELEIQLHIHPDFHINGHEPAAGMIATELHLDEREVERIEYPAGQTYKDQVSIVVRYKSDVTQKQRMAIKYQACDESACLPEVTRQFEVAPASSR